MSRRTKHLDCHLPDRACASAASLYPMTNKVLARRLERLEARLLPATEERVLILNLVWADGEIVGTKEFKLSTDRSPIKRNRRWQR